MSSCSSGSVPGAQDRADLAGQVAANAGQLVEPALTGQRGGRYCQRFDRPRRRAVGPDAERVLTLDLQKIRDLLEAAGDVDVFHRAPRMGRVRRVDTRRRCSAHCRLFQGAT